MTRTVHDEVRFWRHPGTGLEVLNGRFGGHAYDRHAHGTYAIGVTLHGRQGFSHRGRRHVSTPGTVIAMNPDEAHDGEAAGDEGFGYWMLYPDAELWRSLLVDAAGGPADPPFFADTLIADPATARGLVRLCRAVSDPGASRLAVDHALADALLPLARRHGRSAAPAGRTSRDAAVARIRDLLHAHYDRDFRLEELAAEAGRSRFQVSRAFAASYGLPPHAWLTRRRLEVARELLRAGQPAAEVAAAVGFVDQSHLIRRFKASYGITPGQFQAACTAICTSVQSG
ncbi:transcriptional regulator [Thalassobaculum fulvum]|uniref:Transcriptional regulator n=1 Tax=Thalassobaculum fulvum TaxID=1633335 RepID=A0A918XPQ3_9PROT|nr:AraC family transcriptional regulator [Thalassobaculum fulvum]GHD45348.1 transcriptional regulator [Thalassobaculum fulvum]